MSTVIDKIGVSFADYRGVKPLLQFGEAGCSRNDLIALVGALARKVRDLFFPCAGREKVL